MVDEFLHHPGVVYLDRSSRVEALVVGECSHGVDDDRRAVDQLGELHERNRDAGRNVMSRVVLIDPNERLSEMGVDLERTLNESEIVLLGEWADVEEGKRFDRVTQRSACDHLWQSGGHGEEFFIRLVGHARPCQVPDRIR